MRTIYPLILLLLAPATAFPEPELKGSPDELQRYLLGERSAIFISGSGEEKVQADTTIVTLAVKTKENKLQAALDKNIRIRKDAGSRMVAGGIPEQQIETAKYSSVPSYGWLGDKPTAYEISNEIKITIDKESQLQLIAGIADSVNEVYFLRTELKQTKKHEGKAKALEKSLHEVNSKKQLYEKSLGMSLLPVRVIEQSVHEAMPVAFQAPRKAVASLSSLEAPVGETSVGEASTGFGEITYRAQTQVEFIVNRKRQ